jgi:hypothetical protein
LVTKDPAATQQTEKTNGCFPGGCGARPFVESDEKPPKESGFFVSVRPENWKPLAEDVRLAGIQKAIPVWKQTNRPFLGTGQPASRSVYTVAIV